MNRKHFKQRSLLETVRLLCEAMGDDYMVNGRINKSAIAAKAGTSQANITRWLAKTFKPKDENIKKLAKAFGVTPSQLRGEEPIDIIDGMSPSNEDDLHFFRTYQSLPDWQQNLIREQVATYDKNRNEA